MHDHLRDLGRSIADQEDSLGRLWRATDDIHDLWQQSRVIREVRGIRTVRGLSYFYHIREPESDEELSWFKNWCDEVLGNCLRKLIDTTPYRFRKLQLVATEDDHLESILRRVESPNLIWLRWNNCPYSCLPSWIPMKNIRVLEVVGTKLKKLWRAESQAPLELRELNVYAPLSMFPKSIGQMKHIEKIVVTCMPDLIHLKSLPEEFCQLSSLKYLHLLCPDMKSLPDSFGYLTNLQHLNLSRCRSLQGFPNSFRNLIRLKYLNLEYCSDLTMSEETFANISTLEYLNLSDCKSVQVLPRQLAHQPSLEILSLSETNLKELPGDIGNLSSLEELSLGNSLLEMLPCSLGHLSSLKKLWVCDSPELKSLPDSLGQLTQLSTLWVGGCGIQSLPPEVAKMNNLVELRVRECPLRELLLKNQAEGEEETLADPTGRRESNLDSSVANAQQQCMYRLGYLQLWQTEISHISFGEGVCPNLKQLDIRSCAHLVDVGALPPTLIRLKLYKCRRLSKIEGICNLTKLRKLNIRKCIEVEDLPSLERLTSLEKFSADECSKLKRIKGLGQLAALRILYMSSCKALEELTGVETLRSLEKLNVVNCRQLQWGEGVVEQLGRQLKFFDL
uniref:Rx N-terminal domain-containing protein n=1 Tax=Picea sitchensis TaxID=3332 RepID=B8LMZ7_PICSI|nr:unknown [Picea sitchensis]